MTLKTFSAFCLKAFTVLCLSAFFLVSATSCKKETPTPEPEPEPPVVKAPGAYVLNNGNWGSNDASLGLYNPETKEYNADIFFSANGKKLGDLAQDMIIVEDKLYIGVSNSKIIFVTDFNAKIVKEITYSADGTDLSPRMFAYAEGKVYVSYYEGYLGEIDPETYAVRTIQVGPNPEGVAYAGGKLYVANSGGMNYPVYNNTVSVVDPATFTVTKTLEVGTNPSYMKVDSQGDVYLATVGNYADIPSQFQKINSTTDEVSNITEVSATWMAMGAADKLYIASSTYDADWNAVVEFYVYNAATEKLNGQFIKDDTTVPNAYFISADPISRNIYIGSSDYVTNGDMYVFSDQGILLDKFDTGGLNPIGVY